MSKVRPKRGPRLSPSNSTPLVVFEPITKTEETSSADCTSTTSSCSSGTSSPLSELTDFSAYTETFSESELCFGPQAKMFKHLPYSSDSGFGIMNPMYDDGSSKATDITDDPSKSTIPTSKSLPTLPTTISNVVTPMAKTTSVCSSTDSKSAKQASRTPSISSPPSPPQPPVKTTPTESVEDKVSSNDVKNNNSAGSDLVTPPNTPHSNLSSPTEKETKVGTEYINPLDAYNDDNDIYNPAKETKGQLYNILGYPVDLPDTKSPTLKNNRISPEDTETKKYPFSTYPKPSILDNFTDSEKVIEHLVKLGNGVYKDSGKPKNGPIKSPTEVKDVPKKKDDWINLDDKDQQIARCWNHSTEKPKTNNKKQKKPQESAKKKDDEDKKDRGVQFHVMEYVPVIKRDKSKLTKKSDADENKRSSLFEDLDLPMIDADVDSKKSDSSTVTTTTSDHSFPPAEFPPLENNLEIPEDDEFDELAEHLTELTSEAGRLISKEVKEGISYLTKPEDTLAYNWIDTAVVLVSIFLFYFDLISDCILVYTMYYDRHSMGWFTIALLFLIVPLVLVNAFSLYWYWFDERVCEPNGACYRHPRVSKCVWFLRVLAHLLLQGSVLRQIDVLYYGKKSQSETVNGKAVINDVMREALEEQEEEGIEGLKSRDRKYEKKGLEKCTRRVRGLCSRGGYVALWIHAERDATNVDMFLALVQDAPQLILHFYIMALTMPSQIEYGEFSETLVWQILKEGFAFLFLAWSVASFIRAIRLVEPTMSNLSLRDVILLMFSHLFSIAGQVMSFALFASMLLIPFLAVAGAHWLLMFVWILVQKTIENWKRLTKEEIKLLCFPRTTCTRAVYAHHQRHGRCSKLEDIFYSTAMGFVFLFTFVDVGGISPRTQFFLYQTFKVAEETTLLVIWFIWVNGFAWYHWLALGLVPVFSCLCVLFDVIFCALTTPVTCTALCISPKSI